MIPVSNPGPQWPTRYEVWSSLRRGAPVELEPIVPGETSAIQSKREIDSAWIASLSRDSTGLITVPVIIKNAIITGDLLLRFITFQRELRIERCVLRGTIDLSFCVFLNAAVFDGSTFEKRVYFNGAKTVADMEWSATVFGDKMECQAATIGRNLCSQGTSFQICDLEGTSIGGLAIFKDEDSSPAHFGGETTFDLVNINGGLQVQHSAFDSDVTFTAATIKNFADFSDVVFRGKAQFDGARILGDAKFDRAQFCPKAVPSDADVLRFPGVRIGGQAVFDRCTFAASVRFDQIRFDAEAFFESARFSGAVRFDGAVFSGPARFNRAAFNPPKADSRIDFRGARAANIDFRGAEFMGGTISFQDADFAIAYFRDEVAAVQDGAQFPARCKGTLDLRGFKYERIFIAWREMVAVLAPYDVQPYRQLERAFRTMGKDNDADSVYLSQRWRAFRNNMRPAKRWPIAAGQLIYGLVARFGVRPWRLAFVSLLLLLVSTGIFSQRDAVSPKKDSNCVTHQLDMREAFGVSLNYFLPVQVPVADCWVATNHQTLEVFGESVSFALWASLLKLLGWIVVPLGVAALSGVLRQSSSK